VTSSRGVLADAAVLAEFASRTFADTFAADNRPEDLQTHLLSSYGVTQQSAELADPNVITVLAYRGGVLTAYAQLGRHSKPSCVTQDEPIELHRFYVDHSAHGRRTHVCGFMELRGNSEAVTCGSMFGSETLGRSPSIQRWDSGRWESRVLRRPDRQTDHVLVAAVRDADDRSQ
jgi:hypothetical protein